MLWKTEGMAKANNGETDMGEVDECCEPLRNRILMLSVKIKDYVF